MHRYFFNVRSPSGLLVDEAGIEFASLSEAEAAAQQGARDLMAADLRAGRTVDHQGFEVRDEAGALVISFLFRDVLRLP